MMKGRKPKPAKLKLLEGNPGKRPIKLNTPQPTPKRPTCPRWLSKEAKREWKRVVPELERLGLLTVVDRAALAGYCESWAEYREAREFIHKHGVVNPIKDDDGNIKYLQQVPQVSIANKALANIRAFCSMFGLSPSDRERMTLPTNDTTDEMEELLQRVKK